MKENNCPHCEKDYAGKNGLLQHRRRKHPDTFETYCPDCGLGVNRLGSHLSRSQCKYPSVSQRQHEIIQGLVMGDAWVMNRDLKSPIISLEMINLRFLEWVQEELDTLSKVLEKRDETRYAFRTMGHPEFHKYADWYDSGKKRFPSNMDISPLTAKVWYACDGGIQTNAQSGRAKIWSVNESDRQEMLISLFDHIEGEIEYRESSEAIVFQQEATEAFLDWIGDPVPGFDYKWCNEGSEKYYQLKGES